MVAFVALGIVTALALGQDANYDLLNYHLYNPWAWLTGRFGRDFVPAQLQTFHSPVLDVPLYLMVAADWPPRVITAVLAMPAGVAAYFVYRIARVVFARLAPAAALAAVGSAVLIGVTGPNGVSMLGTTLNEWPGAALVAIATFLLVRDITAGKLRMTSVVAAGLLAGTASGLKLTAASYAAGIAVALLFTPGLPSAIRAAFIFGIATLVGIAVTLGPWMVDVYRLTGNPLFPYFNPLFRSDWLPYDWTLYKGFGPRTAMQWFSFPLDLWSPPRLYVSEMLYRDARFPAVASLGVATLLAAIVRRASGRRASDPDHGFSSGQRAALRFGAIGFVVSFVVWAYLHAIHRYLLTLETLTGVAIVAMTLALAPARFRVAAVMAMAALIVVTTAVPSWTRVPFGKRFLSVDAPPLPAGSVVVVVGGPFSYALPELRADVRYVGIRSNFMPVEWEWGLHREARRILDAHQGPIVSLSIRGEDPAPAWAKFRLAKSGDCGTLRSNLTTQVVDVCPLARMPGR